jgi:Rrf2 family protein
MLSMKAKYGLQALLYLAKQASPVPVLISDLAEKENIPRKFLELILLDLKNHGILNSKKGKGGGYSLRQKPEAIKLGRVIRVLDGPLAPVPCVSQTAYGPCDGCEDEHTRGSRIVM